MGFAADLTIAATPTVTWFMRSRFYDHYSLLCRYEGWVSTHGERTDVAGMCTYEYGSSGSVYNLADSPLLARLKVPVDQFTYQIVNLDEANQLLLGRTFLKRISLGSFARVRSVDRPGTRTYDATMSVVHAATPLITPDGREMLVPETLEWTVTHDGRQLGRLEARVDTPWVYGLGAGFVAGYEITGTLSEPETGRSYTLERTRGYIEWSDVRPIERQLAGLHPGGR